MTFVRSISLVRQNQQLAKTRKPIRRILHRQLVVPRWFSCQVEMEAQIAVAQRLSQP